MSSSNEVARAVERIEYEALIFGRQISELPGRSRRSNGVLDQSAYALLTLLEVQGPQSIGEMVVTTGLDPSTLNRQTSALLRNDYAVRIADPEGGLARKFQISETGLTLLHEERAATYRIVAKLTQDWAEEDQLIFANLLERFNRSVEHLSGRHWPRPKA